MPDYQLSKVYQIVCLTTGQKYVGSTTQATLALRLAGHNSHFKRWKNGTYPFVTSFTILEHGNYQIELLEACPCNSKDELNAREGHYIRTIDCVNKQIAGRTRQEYKEDNKIEIAEKVKEYYETNLIEISEYQKVYRIDNKTHLLEKRKDWYDSNKTKTIEYNKAYREANKAKKKETDKAYREANKTKTAEYMKTYYLKKKAEKLQ